MSKEISRDEFYKLTDTLMNMQQGLSDMQAQQELQRQQLEDLKGMSETIAKIIGMNKRKQQERE
jgi:ACT domain-containing protein